MFRDQSRGEVPAAVRAAGRRQKSRQLRAGGGVSAGLPVRRLGQTSEGTLPKRWVTDPTAPPAHIPVGSQW